MNYKEKRQLNLRNYILLFVAFIFLFFPLFMIHNSLFAAVSSPDAIAIRVMPNPSHISALRWYKEQKFTGAPQSLLIDGYEAVRDGRTVYVNAANIGSDNSFYTNIYVISYNQAAENATIDIFGQILSHWKFNTNIEEFKKIELVKDTARLADLADIRIALENYKQDPQHGYYPKLTSGSYLANKTISTWPSWQDTLAKELGGSLPTDPVNKLGKCDGYNETTCWNEQTKEFATTFPVLPAGSQAIVYSAAADGLSYSLCAVMTSGYVSPAEAGACGNTTLKINLSPDVCSAGSCCPISAGIQVCADNCHETYFNGQHVSSACDWSSVQEFNVSIQLGKNVIATKAVDWGTLYGVSVTFNRVGCLSMTTDDLANWKCTTTPGSGWTGINYDDSSWPAAVYGHPGTAGIRAGNYLTYAQIWASGAGAGTTVYCRYIFMAD